jgi:hypothetical protein
VVGTAAEAFSIRRLEGRRWCLRLTLAMGSKCRFLNCRKQIRAPFDHLIPGWLRPAKMNENPRESVGSMINLNYARSEARLWPAL